MSDLTNYRKSYEKSALNENELPEDPLNLFHKWFKETEAFGGVEEVNAMTISTLGLDGFPKARVVLLKKYNENGFVFYTNYESEKGKALQANPHVCLSFFWPSIERQVIIKGLAEKTSDLDSDNYFHSRPFGSQIGAIVSPQSDVIPNREFLENRLKELEQQWEGKEVPRPEFWGGFLVRPVSVEFWQGRPNRLHDRIRYSIRDEMDWKIERLSS
ncbi:pyridoxamine 5'-phosphate oxidase [Flavobacterium agricola]|uniref:Pyridoxine/pyridoxamine 5'-phosphate oxidase n=1 Tax=Flavobacterium agricola TaxID=2870839 RepID=A0ABY6M3B4_9FLAO|nr:pyridoxamine 5'-phosphate oxidase [Flavobacterium agricola]UYW02325.1 pyridoxamine 5'-phosphate oxidase [Flavobacterium agricola]